ncbi:MAG TPA: hypothetical protein VHO50_04100 [Bacteroidales bacterium]|nr:hypothetical protein [Bacteroidales bacterium]
MMKAIRFLILFSLFVSFIPMNGQEVEVTQLGTAGKTVKYTPDFRFKDGIYLDFVQVKNNNPVPKAKLLTSIDYNDREFYKKLLENDKIYYYDNMGIRQELTTGNIWGYSRNGVLYIQIQESFNRITFVGNISHFVADVVTYSNYYSPYGYDPYYSPFSYGSYYPYSPYSPYYSPYRSNPSHEEVKQYIIDFENGKVLEFNLDNTELLLIKDAELYEEWVNLPKRKRKEMMFVYIRKFNEKNPLYIPQ